MKILKKISSFFGPNQPKVDTATADRVALLERNYLVLLKRVLEMDGIKLVPKRAEALNSKVLQTPIEDHHKGLHEHEPTIH